MLWVLRLGQELFKRVQTENIEGHLAVWLKIEREKRCFCSGLSSKSALFNLGKNLGSVEFSLKQKSRFMWSWKNLENILAQMDIHFQNRTCRVRASLGGVLFKFWEQVYKRLKPTWFKIGLSQVQGPLLGNDQTASSPAAVFRLLSVNCDLTRCTVTANKGCCWVCADSSVSWRS